MTYLFLYSELAGYTINCFSAHMRLNPADEIHVVHYPVNPEAPFRFESVGGVNFYEKDELGMDGMYELINRINPDLILTSGWIDKDYTRLARMFRGKYNFVLCFDNIWRGTLRQRLLLPFARYVMRPLFKWCWVPGEQQKAFALRMGFPEQAIKSGFYATDISLFSNMGKNKPEPAGRPRRFICVARYIPEKAYDLLWAAFADLYEAGFRDWELWCAGTGILYDQRMEHPGIRHLGFVQPAEMDYIVNNTDVFVLPSHFEPWGMVVQEFAAAGYPLILSTAVGAGSAFLKNGENGWLFDAGHEEALKDCLMKAMMSTDAELDEKGKLSQQLAGQSDALAWSQSLSQMAAV